MLELGKSGVSLDPLPETRRSAVRPFHQPVILGLLSEDLESVSRQEATKCPAGECIGVPLVDMEGGQHLVEDGTPDGVNVHRQVEAATRLEDSRNLPNDLRGREGMIDDVVDDHERERGATKRESLPGAREIGRAWFSEPDQTRSLSVELFERIDRIALAPLERIDDPDGTAPDFEDSAGFRSRNRNRGEVLFSRAPLTFEAIRTRMAARPAEIECAEPLHACRSENFPVQEHIGAQRQVLLQTRGPGPREAVFEGERNQAAHRRAALPYQSDPSAGSESIQDSAEESGSVHRRPEVAHSLREDLVKGRQLLPTADLDRQSRALSLPDLIPNTRVEVSPHATGSGAERKGEVHLVLHRLRGQRQSLRATEFHDPRSDAAGLAQEMLDHSVGEWLR